ncbi:uncharacterized protein [Henckelia pumila]|uniref:uncharacterized protein n=1 Tax=Henckelia pumila TaxID=405737 RepID=UPI003C6E8A78
MAENNPPPLGTIRDHFKLIVQAHYSGIARGTINANNFELKPALINMVQQNQFNGSATADPHLHLRMLLEITHTVNINEVSEDIIRLRWFPFSLRDQARYWLQSLSLRAEGKIFANDPVQAYEMLEQMTINNFQWSNE